MGTGQVFARPRRDSGPTGNGDNFALMSFSVLTGWAGRRMYDGTLFVKVHCSAAGPRTLVLGYSNGNAVKIRDGRAAVSARSDGSIGNPRGRYPLSAACGWEGASR